MNKPVLLLAALMASDVYADCPAGQVIMQKTNFQTPPKCRCAFGATFLICASKKKLGLIFLLYI